MNPLIDTGEAVDSDALKFDKNSSYIRLPASGEAEFYLIKQGDFDPLNDQNYAAALIAIFLQDETLMQVCADRLKVAMQEVADEEANLSTKH